MTTKHTPGPWRYHAEDRLVETAMPGLRGEFEFICEFRKPVNEADAHLIAAAPELLEACERTVQFLKAWADNPKARTENRLNAFADQAEWLSAAIAKARGQ